MRKGFVPFVCLILIISAFFIPFNSMALTHGRDTKLTNAEASFIGENSGDNSGNSVAMAGDVNGDGYDDILIGAYYEDSGGISAGQTYLILGAPSGWAMDRDLSNANASFYGETAGDYSGFSVAGAGDVNGDGYDDILIGAYGNDDGGISAGQTYLILGKASGWAMDKDLSTADASFYGETAGDYSGYSVAGAGDVNGDGYDDFLIGAYENVDGGGAGAGQTYLLLGKASGWAMDTDLSNSNASFWGEASDDRCGWSVDGAGDFNGDGIDDLLIGSYRSDDNGMDAGQNYVIYGKKSGWAMDTDLANSNASFQGEVGSDYAGKTVAGVGDVNGDGFDDIMIGAYDSSDGGLYAGQSYLILGSDSAWAMDTDLSKANASFWGENANDYSGWPVAGAGDVDGDGYDDILIGAYDNDEGGSNAGQAYLILGKAAGWAIDTDLANSKADASFWGEDSSDLAGVSVAGEGDVNGDGYSDILVGASGDEDGGGAGAGQTYLIFEKTNMPPSAVTSVKAYSDGTFSTEITGAMIDDTVYIELVGTDANVSSIDHAFVQVTSNVSDKKGFTMRLTETGKNTGKYRSDITIKDRTWVPDRWINATYGESVKIASVQTPLKNATVTVMMKMVLRPAKDVTSTNEDAKYLVHYWSGVPTVKWTFKTNASWLKWDPTAHNVSGIPTNADVGTYYVCINITNISWGADEHNFTLRVINTPPDISITDVVTALEDKVYRVDYNSTDDGQGKVTYHLKTNASSWLGIDPGTGVLNGTPSNNDVGKYYVNVSVDDGHGGWDHSNFTLTVQDANDPPSITSTDLTSTYEDALYKVQYNVTDIDKGDKFTWHLSTSAPGWLSIGSTTGVLSGVPTNDNVGKCWVNVTVSDKAMAYAFHNFTLTVINTNDAPAITSVPLQEVDIHDIYRYDVNASDVDVSDGLNYSLDKAPLNMTIDRATGLITWKPVLQQEGANPVIVNVSDGHVFVTQTFTITMVVTWSPEVTLVGPADGSQLTSTMQRLVWTWKDQDSTNVFFDVYLGKVQADVKAMASSVRIAHMLITPNYMVTNLETGATYYWTVIPSDGKNLGTCTNGVWSFTVASTATNNREPVITSTPIGYAEVGEKYGYNVEASDDDIGDVLTFSLSQRPDGMVIDQQTGVISWTPTMSQLGEQSVTVAVSDGKASKTQIFKITVTRSTHNHRPAIQPIPDSTITVGDEFQSQVMANDVDAGDQLIFTLAGQPSGMTMSPSGAISWKPTGGQVGTYTITVNVSDNKDPATAQFKVTVVKKKTASWFSGTTVLMLGILVAVIAAVVIALVVMMVKRGRKKEEPEEPPIASRPEPDKPGVQFEVVDMDEMNEPKEGTGQKEPIGERPRPVQRKVVKTA